MAPGLAERYRATMRSHRMGYALYEPALFTRLRPGMLGYLDEYRRWHPILDLSDEAAVQAAGYSPIYNLQRSEPDVRTWGPLKSSNVKETTIEFKSNIDAAALAGLPVDIGGVVEYSTNTDFGAVLMCDAEVVAEGYEFPNSFLVWLKQNSKKLLADYPDVKEHGVYVATWTYSSTDVHINAWDNPSTTVTIGLKLGMTAVGSAKPKVSWVRKSENSGWTQWTGQKRVVFFTGVKLKFNFFGTRQVKETRWRGPGDDFIIDGDEPCEVEVEFFGDDWEEIKNDQEDEDGDDE